MPDEKQQNFRPIHGLELFFMVCLIVSAFLWESSPATSDAHRMFRLGLSTFAVVGLSGLLLLRFTRKK